jgi:hypothetical protein
MEAGFMSWFSRIRRYARQVKCKGESSQPPQSGAFVRSTLIVFCCALVGCATPATNFTQISSLEDDDDSLRILLMPIDVELSILTAGGLMEPQAEWTRDARNYMTIAIKDASAERKAGLIAFEENPAVIDPVEVQLQKLHEAVGFTILSHKYGVMPLPTKEGKFDWTLGDEVNALREKYDADYALFVFVRDSYSSGGRVAFQIAAAIMGVGVPGGIQVGFASLVDLDNGEVVWFNRLARASGDLRNQVEAAETVRTLLAGLPGS